MGESKKPTAKTKSKSVQKANDNERAARKQMLEDLFYDFNASKTQVYTTNFIRGIFLGFGTVLGGTVFVALFAWILGLFAGWFPAVGDYINAVVQALQK